MRNKAAESLSFPFSIVLIVFIYKKNGKKRGNDKQNSPVSNQWLLRSVNICAPMYLFTHDNNSKE